MNVTTIWIALAICCLALIGAAATPRVVGKWVLPDNCVIVERTGEKFALVGPPMRRIEPAKD